MAPKVEDGPVNILSEKERIARFGVVCTCGNDDGVQFENWEPGGEYIRKLTLKNVSRTMRKLKYKLPMTRYLSLAFPQNLELPPGMSIDLDIVFRPIVTEEFFDTIYFKLQDEIPITEMNKIRPRGFHVPVRAVLKKLECCLESDTIEFGLCPTKEESVRFFRLTNTGQVPAPFAWNSPAPFLIEPKFGTLQIGASIQIKASIRPMKANVLVARAICRLGKTRNEHIQKKDTFLVPKPLLELRLSAIVKFTHIVLSDTRIDFGSVLAYTKSGDADQGTKREILIKNTSPVVANVKVRRIERDRESVFSIIPSSFTLNPNSEINLAIHYTPRPAGCFVCDHFEFLTPGGNRPRLEITGEATSANVQLYKKQDNNSIDTVLNSINFGCVQVQSTATRVLFLQNDTTAPLRYQFLLGISDSEKQVPTNTFSIKDGKERGILPPGGLAVGLQLICHPQSPSQYYQRVFVLIERRLPLFIDLIATAYQPATLLNAKEQKPATLRHAHLQAYRNRIVRGWGLLAPMQLDEKFNEIKQYQYDHDSSNIDTLCFARIGADGHDALLMACTEENPVSRSGEATRTELAVATEMFEHEQALILVDAIKGLDLAPGTSKIISVENKTQAKVTIVWTEINSQFLSISPSGSIDVGPNQNVNFSVHCNGPVIATSIEATAFFKNQRSFRLADDATLQPPWHLETLVFGAKNSLLGLSPQLTFFPSDSLEFTPVFAGDATYQMLTCRNKSKLPAVFEIMCCDTESSCFRILPRRGLIPAEGFQLFIVQFKAPDIAFLGKEKEAFKLRVNGFDVWGPMLLGAGAVPECELEDIDQDLSVTLPPTSIGLESMRIIGLRNSSRVPCIFHINEANDILKSAEPATGVLRGHERANIALRFAPNDAIKATNTQLSISVRPVAGQPPIEISAADARQLGSAQTPEILQKFQLQVFTPASTGQVSIEPPMLSFPISLVKASQTDVITLVNASQGPVAYTMMLKSVQNNDLILATEPPLSVDIPTGLLPARSRKSIRLTFQPQFAGDFEMLLVCKLNNAHNLVYDSECLVKGRASYPTVCIRDARMVNGDCRPGCDSSQLWQQFSLTELNEALTQPPTVDVQEEKFKFRFIPQPVAAGTQTVLLDVYNPGELAVSLSVHWPNEREVDLEDWADEGEPTEAEVRINRIIDELKCFELSPRTAELGPSESMTLRISYAANSRELDGIHDLPLLFKVNKGRHLKIELVGRTLGFSEPCLFLGGGIFAEDNIIPSKTLAAVSVGVRPEDAPLQICQLVNLGNAACNYSLRFHRRDILCPSIENPSGYIDALCSVPLRFRFLPLEARNYQFEAELEYSWSADDFNDEHFAVKNIRLEISGFDARAIRTVDRKVQDPPFVRLAQATKSAQSPDHQIVSLPQQIAMLSQDRLEFGTLPQRARVTQLVALLPKTDVEATTFFEYEWQQSNELHDILSIEPQSGSIQAGVNNVSFFRVELRADCEPQAIDDSILLLVRECLPQATRGRRGTNRGSLSSTIGNNNSVESLASRCTATQEKHLTHKLLPSGRLPTMPISSLDQSIGIGRQPTSPLKSTTTSSTNKLNESSFLRLDLTQDSVSSAFQGGTKTNSKSVVVSSSILRLRLLADIVKEEHFTSIHGGDLDVLRLPKPAVFIPAAVTKSEHVLESDESVSREKARAAALRSQAAELFREALSSHETTQVLQLLPTQPVVPFYSDIQCSNCSSIELVHRFTVWQGDHFHGRLRGSEIRDIIVRELGIRCSSTYLDALDKEKEEIDFESWLASLPIELRRGIALALNEALSRSRFDRATEREKNRQTNFSDADKNMAATRIGSIFRRNMARHAVDKRHYLATTLGQLEEKGAIALQNQIRKYRSRKRAKAALDKRLNAISSKLFANHSFQHMLYVALENTIYNLIQEAVLGEFPLIDNAKEKEESNYNHSYLPTTNVISQ